MFHRFDEKEAVYSFLIPLLLYGTPALLLLFWLQPQFYLLKHGAVVSLTLFALWRYGWMLLNYSRAFLYRFFYYPSLKRKAERLPEHARYPKNLYFLIPSYKEDFWVSVESFRSIVSEIKSIPSQVTIVVATSSQQEDRVIRDMFKAYDLRERVKLIFQHQNAGKRIAMGHALRAIAREYHKKKFSDPNSVTIFMDGDSYLQKGFLKQLLPFFASEHNLGAVTTNEVAYINSKNRWYKEWFNLKFGQRHILFQAHSLSRKVMTLTGRLSAYRTDIVIEERFISQVENDIITDPLHGKFRFLMGDDKSTWFYLLKNGWDMLYLPDLLCISLESRDGAFLKLSRSLPYRWFGNTLRNNTRALRLGPRKTGWYIWYAILDQRLVMWTSLVGILSALILAMTLSGYYLLFFLFWIIVIRLLQLFVISFFGHPVSWRMLPLILYTQWVGALIKIKAFYNLSDQSWSKNSDTQKNSDEVVHIRHPLVPLMPKVAMYSALTLFVLVLLLSHGALKLPGSLLPLVQAKIDTADSLQLNAEDYHAIRHRVKIVRLEQYDVVPGKRDIAEKINRILRESDPDIPLTLLLPKGKYDLYRPIVITRSNVVLKGADKEKSIFVSHIQGKDKAVIDIHGERGKRVAFLKKSLYRNQTVLALDRETSLSKYVLIRQPNDTAFVKGLGARKWFKKYPYLRQEIVEVFDHGGIRDRYYITKPILTDFEAGKTEVVSLKMVENVTLENFTVKQRYGNEKIEKYRHDYRNSAPEIMVDAISLCYCAKSRISDLNILQSGSHPLHSEYSYALLFEHLYIDGSWNKGKKGNGYVRISRTFHSVFRESRVENIRHITLQWSACGNRLYRLRTGVDINLHGGFAHRNRIDHITFEIPKAHRWGPIEYCPADARWAPPDGENRIDYATFTYLNNKGS